MVDDPSPDYEWDYEPEEERPTILWGRVLALGAMLLLAFFLGRATGGSSGEVEELRSDLAVARERIEMLEQQDDAAAAGTKETESPEPTEQGRPDVGGGGEDEEGETYTVQQGDTLVSLAERFYGDPTLDEYIATANGIDDPSQLRIGQEIVIPPEP